MDKMPEIYCKFCYKIHKYDLVKNEPKTCDQCGNKFSDWHIATQLANKGQAGRVNVQN